MNAFACATWVLAVHADDRIFASALPASSWRRTAAASGGSLLVAARAPVAEEEQHRRRAVRPAVTGGTCTGRPPSPFRRVNEGTVAAHGAAGAELLRWCPRPVNRKMPSADGQHDADHAGRSCGACGARARGAGAAAAGGSGVLQRSSRRATLVNAVGDEYVARHGHEEHRQVGDGVAEDPHGVAPGGLAGLGQTPQTGDEDRNPAPRTAAATM